MAGNWCTTELGSSQRRSPSPCPLLWESLFAEAPEHVLVHIQEGWHQPEANEPCWTQPSSAEGLTLHLATLPPSLLVLGTQPRPTWAGSAHCQAWLGKQAACFWASVGAESHLAIFVFCCTCQTQTGGWANTKPTQLAVSMALLTQQGSCAYGKPRAVCNGLLQSMLVLKTIMSSQL